MAMRLHQTREKFVQQAGSGRLGGIAGGFAVMLFVWRLLLRGRSFNAAPNDNVRRPVEDFRGLSGLSGLDLGDELILRTRTLGRSEPEAHDRRKCCRQRSDTDIYYLKNKITAYRSNR